MLNNDKIYITYKKVEKDHADFLFNLYNEPSTNSIALNKKGIVEMNSILKLSLIHI